MKPVYDLTNADHVNQAAYDVSEWIVGSEMWCLRSVLKEVGVEWDKRDGVMAALYLYLPNYLEVLDSNFIEVGLREGRFAGVITHAIARLEEFDSSITLASIAKYIGHGVTWEDQTLFIKGNAIEMCYLPLHGWTIAA